MFHIVFGKTVPDISLNAVANLGYADVPVSDAGVSRRHVSATSEVIGLKENSNHKTGIVYVRTRGFNQDDAAVLEYVRWVMVRKRDEAAPAPGDHVPLPAGRGRAQTAGRAPVRRSTSTAYDFALAGSLRIGSTIMRWARRSTAFDGITVEEAEHMTATRLYQNTALFTSTRSPLSTGARSGIRP